MFTTFFIAPLYNLFVWLIGILPGGDSGLAIIFLTLIMRAVLYPVFTASIRTQMGMQAMQGELDETTKKFKDKPELLVRARMDLLKKYKVNPFAGFFALAVQLVVVIALYYAMFHEGFPVIDEELLYSFVQVPVVVSTTFFGLFDLLTPHHVVLALLVGITQYLTIRFTLARTNSKTPALTDEKAMALKMQNNLMLYMMPGLMAVISYTFPAMVGLYFITGNLVSLLQEWMIRRQMPQTLA